MSLILGAAIALIAISAPLAQAQATLHIGFGAGTSCAQGCGGDPNLSGGVTSVLDIFQNSNGADDTTILRLILGVPNDLANLGLAIQSASIIDPYPGATPSPASGTLLRFTPGFHSGDIYDFAGLGGGPGSASASFSNLAGIEATHNVAAANFGVYVYAIASSIGPHGLAQLRFSAPLPTGTFAFAYAEAGDKVYDTPLTESGLITIVPEPAAIGLLATCIALLLPVLRKHHA